MQSKGATAPQSLIFLVPTGVQTKGATAPQQPTGPEPTVITNTLFLHFCTIRSL